MVSPPASATASSRWLTAAIGIASGVVCIGVWWLLYAVGLLTFPPFDLGDMLIRQSPGPLATWAIETLGTRAQTAALTGGVVVWLLAWGALGLVTGRVINWRLAWTPPWLLLPAALWLGWWSEGGMSLARFVWLTVAFGISLAASGALLAFWLGRLAEAQGEVMPVTDSWLDAPGNFQRRELLRQIALVTIAAGAGGGVLGRLLRGAGGAEASAASDIPLDDARGGLASSVSSPAIPLPANFDAPAGVRQRVTPNGEFYVVDISTRDPSLDEAGWVLRVHGLVEREVYITWPDLLSLPAVELDGTLMCISYEHDNGLISTTRWTGVPLRDVLAMAGVRDGVFDLICRGSNGYSDSIPLANALDPTTLLAYGMNGATLSRSHGFPCRLYVPGLYGEKNVKWLQEIELVEYDYKGYWQERGWTDTAVVNTVSIIDTPRTTVLLIGGTVPVAGIAFAGDRGVSTVQVRIDDGAWQDALLEENQPPLIWQRWRFDWRAEPGSYRVSVRAIDGSGNPQVESERPAHPDGMTGLHTLTIDVA